MSGILTLISDLRRSGIELWRDGETLRYRKQSGPLTAVEVNQLKGNKRSLVEWLEKVGGRPGDEIPISRSACSGPTGLSYAQRGLWLRLQIEAAGEAYHLTLGFRILGALDVDALTASMNRILARHEVLRTWYVKRGGDIQQQIAPMDTEFPLSCHDLRGERDLERKVDERVQEEVNAPFDLERGLPVRAKLLRLAPSLYVLILTLHHIAADGWSLGVFTDELSALYRTFALKGEDPLPDLGIQYTDFGLWQRRVLAGQRLRELRLYWRRALEGAPAILELPADRRREPTQQFAAGVLRLSFGLGLSRELELLSRAHDCTLFMTLLGGWVVLLSRLTGQKNIVIGVPTANRARAELDPLIGLFVNALPVHIDLSGNPSFAEVLQRVKAASLSAQDHQELPFDQIVDAVNPPRSSAHSPLFQFMFAWQNIHRNALTLHGLEVVPLTMPEPAVAHDMTLELFETEGGIEGSLHYATALFDEARVARYADYFLQVLRSAVADCAKRIDQIDLLSSEERRRLLVQWNRQSDLPFSELCIHHLFEDQVRTAPDALAILWGTESLTYQQLNQRANQLAHYLLDLDVAPEELVGICMERGPQMVIAMLAIMKAGAAYVPLDPSYPSQRLAYMLEDAEPRILLIERVYEGRLPPVNSRVVNLESVASAIRACIPDNPMGAADHSSDTLAFVIYTSGSTGSPKGVMNHHRGMVNRILAQRDFEQFNASDLCCQKTSISFVDAVFEIFGPLCNGRPLLIIPQEAVHDFRQMAQLIADHRVTQLLTVPSLARSMLEDAQSMARLASLRIWTLSGEEVSTDLVSKLQQRMPGCEFIIQYGASEVSSDAAIHKARRFNDERVPIGRPVPNGQIYILDEHRQPVPTGVTGEIFVGGICVGRGYMRRPQMTAERFVANPFAAPGERLYRTGDLGRWRSDGLLECLGRTDQQIKIRGFRIELGEIETQLAIHVSVSRAAVVAREDLRGEKYLVAYVKPQASHTLTPEVLRDHAQSTLPNYMVPRAFVVLDDFPLTPNGKLDRRSLPLPSNEDLPGSSFEAVQGVFEAGLELIWRSLLDAPRIGRNDNFFELGGHSLHGVALVSQVSERFGIRLPVAAAFQYPTIRQMAQAIEGLQRIALANGTREERHALQPRDRPEVPPSVDDWLPAIPALTERQAPLSFTQIAHWNLYQLDHRPAIRHVACAIRLKGHLRLDALSNSLVRVVSRHEILRTRLALVNKIPIQEVQEASLIPLQVRTVTHLTREQQQEEVQRTLRQLILKPIWPTVGPLWESCILEFADREHVLIIVMEHIISDARSLNNLVRDWFVAYAQELIEGVADLLPKPVQYPTYARLQRQQVHAWLKKHEDVWRERTARQFERVRFPESAPSESRVSREWSTVTVHIDSVLKKQLQDWSRHQRTTLVTTVLTGYVATVFLWCDISACVFAYQTDGRSDPTLHDTIGYLATSIYLRLQWEPNDTFRTLLERVTSELVAAHDCADLSHFEAQAEPPEFTRSTAFNWAPRLPTRIASDLDNTDDALQASNITFVNPVLERWERDAEPYMHCFEGDHDVEVRIYFPVNRFTSGQMERFGQLFSIMLGSMVDEPGRRISTLQV